MNPRERGAPVTGRQHTGHSALGHAQTKASALGNPLVGDNAAVT